MGQNSRGYSAAQIQDFMNRSMPVATECQLGTMLVDILTSVQNILAALDCGVLNKAGLVIKAGSSPIVKSVNDVAASINGVTTIVPASDMAALVGSLATAKSAAWAFYVDGAGNLTASAKTADAASAAAAVALLPAVPAGLAQIGFVVISNATGSPFVGGTTALDAASITTKYHDTVGHSFNSTTVTILPIDGR